MNVYSNMSVLNNFTVSVSRALRRLRPTKHTSSSTLIRRNSTSSKDGKRKLIMDKCLIISKVTRYEYYKSSQENISDEELERILRKRGADYDHMVATHREQKAFEEHVAKSLKDMGIKVEIASRVNYNDELIKWCDVVVPCGGDGTFLLAASRITDSNKPVIGFNSAPRTSVGRLCLPAWCSHDVTAAVNALKQGKFKWLRRTRIRTTLRGERKLMDSIAPVDLHTLHYSRYPPIPTIHDTDLNISSNTDEDGNTNATEPLNTKVLPYLALNEVFLGESVSSRVSLLRLQVDNGKWTRTKGSGLCVTTGTGSTSWHFSINCLRTMSVRNIMKILKEDFNVKLDTSVELARMVTEKYNNHVMFPPDAEHLAYSIREYVTFEEWPVPRGLRVRGRANKVRVKSHCADAGLVIDGSVSFPFNDGCRALLEVYPEDALMSVQMDDIPT